MRKKLTFLCQQFVNVQRKCTVKGHCVIVHKATSLYCLFSRVMKYLKHFCSNLSYSERVLSLCRKLWIVPKLEILTHDCLKDQGMHMFSKELHCR